MASNAVYTDTFRSNWRCFIACGIIVLAPFQYGVDFGLIGGLQAMKGFLEVRLCLILPLSHFFHPRVPSLCCPQGKSHGSSTAYILFVGASKIFEKMKKKNERKND